MAEKNFVDLEVAKQRARDLRPFVRAARISGATLTGRAVRVAQTGRVSPQELLEANPELLKERVAGTSAENVFVPETEVKASVQVNTVGVPPIRNVPNLEPVKTPVADERREKIKGDSGGLSPLSRKVFDRLPEDQKDRFRNVKETLKATRPFDDTRVTSNIKNPKVASFVEDAASNPALAAAEITFLRGAGKAGLSLVKQGVRVGTPATTKSGFLSATKNTARLFPQSVAMATGGAELVRQGVTATTLTRQEAQALRDNQFITSQSFARQAAQQQGFFDKAKFGISVFGGNKEQFRQNVRTIAAERGLNQADTELLVSASSKERVARGSGEITGLLGAGIGGEVAGRQAQRIIFNKYSGMVGNRFLRGATSTAFAVAPAGVTEGVGAELVQQQQRGERFNPKRVGLAGGVGAVTAGALGGVIGGASVSKQRLLKFFSEQTGNVLDVFEAPADFLTSEGIKASRRFSKTITVVPNFAPSPATTVTSTPSIAQSMAVTPTNTRSQSFTTTPTPVPSNPLTNTFTFTQTQTPVNPKQQSFTQTQTNVPTNVFTATNSPVINFRFPAFVPPRFQGGGGGGGAGFRKLSPTTKLSFSPKPTTFAILGGFAKAGTRRGFNF